MKLSVRLVSMLAVLSAMTAVIACGSSNSDSGGGGGSGDDDSLDGGPSDVAFADGTGGGGGGGGGGDGASCYAPVDMYIMLDRSGSMGSDCNIGDNGTSKWCLGINALSGYFKGQGSTGQAAALQVFPTTTHTSALCTSGDQYNVPASPASGYTDLPSTSFDTLLNSTKPDKGSGGFGTPTEAAIRGLTRFTAANRRGGRVTIGILITDGNPNGCDEDLTNLSNLLQAHYAATTIRTYVIGMTGADFKNLEQIAAGGGTPMHDDKVGSITDACGNGAGPCRAWNVGDGDPAVFTAALAAIQASADGCKDGGGTVNPR